MAKTVHLRSGHVKTCGCEAIKERLTFIAGTCVEMIQSQTVRKNNTSGVPGVEWMESCQRWRATIGFKGKRIYLGRFKVLEDAIRARKEAEERLYVPFLEEFQEKNFEDKG